MKMPKPPRQRMFDAIQKDDVKELDIALRSGANVNDRNDAGYTSLHLASRRSPFVFNRVLANFPDLNALDPHGNTALHWACSTAHIEKTFTKNAHALIDAGADLSFRNIDGATALDDVRANNCQPLILAIEARQAEDLRQQLERNTAQATARYATDDYGPWTPTAADTERLERSLAGVAEGEPVVYDQAPARARSMRL